MRAKSSKQRCPSSGVSVTRAACADDSSCSQNQSQLIETFDSYLFFGKIQLIAFNQQITFSDCCFLSEVESRTQGSRPRPRPWTQTKSKAKDSLSEDRPSRGQGQECSRPRPKTKDTAASVLQKKKGLQKSFFRQSPTFRRSQIF